MIAANIMIFVYFVCVICMYEKCYKRRVIRMIKQIVMKIKTFHLCIAFNIQNKCISSEKQRIKKW
jgi:hypothetical protein